MCRRVRCRGSPRFNKRQQLMVHKLNTQTHSRARDICAMRHRCHLHALQAVRRVARTSQPPCVCDRQGGSVDFGRGGSDDDVEHTRPKKLCENQLSLLQSSTLHPSHVNAPK